MSHIKSLKIKNMMDGKSQENELLPVEHKIKDLNDLLIFIKRSKKPCKKFAEYFSTDRYDIIWI